MSLRACTRSRWVRIGLGLLVVVALLSFVVARLIDEPLRRDIERRMNAQLEGYTVRIGELDFHPLGFSVDLENLTVVQNARPKPPIMAIPQLAASVQWRELIRLRLVADFLLERPTLYFNQKQAAQEAKDAQPVQERGWQDAVQEAYPLKINEFRVVDGTIMYTPDGPFAPLRITYFNFEADNIRNIRSRERKYPSEIHLDAVVFDTAMLRADGHADFLATPHAGFKAYLALSQVPLPYLTAAVADYASIRGGVFSTWGDVEFAPKVKALDLDEIAIKGVELDYVLTRANAQATAELQTAAAKKAKEVSNDPEILIRAQRIRLTDGNLGWVDRTGAPPYRVFLSEVDLTAKDFSNRRSQAIGRVDVSGKFMGSGPSVIHATFRPETERPNFDLSLRIEDTDLRTMNDLLRAKGNIDVAGGSFALYSDLTVRDNKVDGYVKPLFKDLDVYDSEQDRKKPLLDKAYERVVGFVAKLLENWSTDEVATKTPVTGPLEDPRTSTWQVILRLFQNAFVKAIQPGLEKPESPA